MQKNINQLKNSPITDDDIYDLYPNCKIVRYSDLYKYESINDLISKGTCFVLYETAPGFGHWVVLNYYQNNIEFFDSYGGKCDTQLKYIPKEFAVQSHQNKPYLSKLLHESLFSISNNPFTFQKMSPNVKDCGKWCILRSKFKDMPIKDFHYLFGGKDGDDLVTFLHQLF